jgi:hypothetical protein
MVCFLLLRLLRTGMMFRYADRVRAQRQHQGGESRVPNNSPFRSSSVFRNNSSTENIQQPQSRSFFDIGPGFTLFNICATIVEGIVGLFCAELFSFVFSDRSSTMEWIVGLPLIQGKSELADEFCPVVISEWIPLEREFAVAAAATNEVQVLDPPPNDNALSGLSASGSPLLSISTAMDSPNLRAVVEFKDNCLRRQAYERRLRRYSGPVSIPPPCVPTLDDPSLLLLQLDGDGSPDDSDYAIFEPLSWMDGVDSINWDDSVSPK